MVSTDGQLLNDITGVILAGGQSRRMGQEKARLLIQHEPLIARVARLLHAVFPRVVVVGSPDLSDILLDTPIIPDLRPAQGPLAGLEAAFGGTATPLLFLVGCDMPFVSPALAQRMAERAYMHSSADAVVLRAARGLEPLHAVYRRDCQLHVSALLDMGERSLLSLLSRVTVEEIPPDERALFDPNGLATLNVNTPREWQAALALAEE